MRFSSHNFPLAKVVFFIIDRSDSERAYKVFCALCNMSGVAASVLCVKSFCALCNMSGVAASVLCVKSFFGVEYFLT